MPNPSQTVPTQWTILKLLNWSTAYFKDHDVDSPRATAEILLAHALDLQRIDLYLHHDKPLDSEELAAFKALLQRRVRREPVAYIVGRKEFWSLELAVDGRVLIPRPETECLVEAVLGLLQDEFGGRPRRILDVGTGSGAIVLALASEPGGHRFWAGDVSTAAVALARANATRLGLGDRIHFFCGDWFGALKPDAPPFDIVVSNPPYIAAGAIESLQPEIKRFEPRLALDGSADGLACLRRIIEEAPFHLGPAGALVLEIGHDQKTAVARHAAALGGYSAIEFRRDYAGHDRIALLRRRT